MNPQDIPFTYFYFILTRILPHPKMNQLKAGATKRGCTPEELIDKKLGRVAKKSAAFMDKAYAKAKKKMML